MQTTQALGMPALQAPSAMPFVLAAKLFTLRRIIAGSGAVTHSSQFRLGEQLELTHAFIVPHPIQAR
jgi:hypothetical protein